MYAEAEQAFTQVLKLDKNCDDAVQELLRVRTHQIMVSLNESVKINLSVIIKHLGKDIPAL